MSRQLLPPPTTYPLLTAIFKTARYESISELIASIVKRELVTEW